MRTRVAGTRRARLGADANAVLTPPPAAAAAVAVTPARRMGRVRGSLHEPTAKRTRGRTLTKSPTHAPHLSPHTECVIEQSDAVNHDKRCIGTRENSPFAAFSASPSHRAASSSSLFQSCSSSASSLNGGALSFPLTPLLPDATTAPASRGSPEQAAHAHTSEVDRAASPVVTSRKRVRAAEAEDDAAELNQACDNSKKEENNDTMCGATPVCADACDTLTENQTALVPHNAAIGRNDVHAHESSERVALRCVATAAETAPVPTRCRPSAEAQLSPSTDATGVPRKRPRRTRADLCHATTHGTAAPSSATLPTRRQGKRQRRESLGYDRASCIIQHNDDDDMHRDCVSDTSEEDTPLAALYHYGNDTVVAPHTAHSTPVSRAEPNALRDMQRRTPTAVATLDTLHSSPPMAAEPPRRLLLRLATSRCRATELSERVSLRPSRSREGCHAGETAACRTGGESVVHTPPTTSTPLSSDSDDTVDDTYAMRVNNGAESEGNVDGPQEREALLVEVPPQAGRGFAETVGLRALLVRWSGLADAKDEHEHDKDDNDSVDVLSEGRRVIILMAHNHDDLMHAQLSWTAHPHPDHARILPIFAVAPHSFRVTHSLSPPSAEDDEEKEERRQTPSSSRAASSSSSSSSTYCSSASVSVSDHECAAATWLEGDDGGNGGALLVPTVPSATSPSPSPPCRRSVEYDHRWSTHPVRVSAGTVWAVRSSAGCGLNASEPHHDSGAVTQDEEENGRAEAEPRGLAWLSRSASPEPSAPGGGKRVKGREAEKKGSVRVGEETAAAVVRASASTGRMHGQEGGGVRVDAGDGCTRSDDNKSTTPVMWVATHTKVNATRPCGDGGGDYGCAADRTRTRCHTIHEPSTAHMTDNKEGHDTVTNQPGSLVQQGFSFTPRTPPSDTRVSARQALAMTVAQACRHFHIRRTHSIAVTVTHAAQRAVRGWFMPEAVVHSIAHAHASQRVARSHTRTTAGLPAPVPRVDAVRAAVFAAYCRWSGLAQALHGQPRRPELALGRCALLTPPHPSRTHRHRRLVGTLCCALVRPAVSDSTTYAPTASRAQRVAAVQSTPVTLTPAQSLAVVSFLRGCYGRAVFRTAVDVVRAAAARLCVLRSGTITTGDGRRRRERGRRRMGSRATRACGGGDARRPMARARRHAAAESTLSKPSDESSWSEDGGGGGEERRRGRAMAEFR